MEMEYISYRLIQFIVSFLPLKFAYCIAEVISVMSYYFVHRARKVLKENLRNAFPNWTGKEVSECARRNFIQFGKFLIDFFYVSKLNSKNINKFVEIENKEYVDEAFARGRGVIAAAAHFGGWELGGVAVALHGYPINAIVLSHKQEKVDAIFVHQRESKGVRVIPLGKAGRAMKALLRGEMVAIVADRDITSKGIEMPFFGKQAVFPRGMPALAVRIGASILPCFVIRQENNRYKLIFEKPFRADLSKSSSKSERDVLGKWIKILEKYVVLYPEQWFMYHRIWE